MSASLDSKNPDDPEKPLFIFHRRYLKDASFESYGVPTDHTTEPIIAINTKVSGSMGDNLVEVVLSVMVTAEYDFAIKFIAEIDYAGLFAVETANEDDAVWFIYVTAPELLFVHGQRIIADLVRDGGFPQLQLAAPDFATAWKIKAASRPDIDLDLDLSQDTILPTVSTQPP